MNDKLASEKVILSSPMSFSGSAARIWRITEKGGILRLLLIPFALSLIAVAWCCVLAWYAVFGIFLVPWRLLRRGQRKNKQRELQHREMLERVQKAQQ